MLKITTNLGNDTYINKGCLQGAEEQKSHNVPIVHSLHAFHLKFTIDANVVYLPAQSKFSMSIVCANHYGQYLSIAAFTVS